MNVFPWLSCYNCRNTFVDSFIRNLGKLDVAPKLKGIPMSVHDHLTRRSGSTETLEKHNSWFKKPTAL